MQERINRVYWVDAAKVLAIIAVLVDHSYNVLYTNQQLHMFSYFSVSVFILLMGVTSYWSYSRYTGKPLKKVYKNLLKILRPYVVATFVYSIVNDHCFYYDSFFKRLINFNACFAYYYVLLYVQLLLVAPLLYYVLNHIACTKHELVFEILALLGVIIFASFSTTHTFIGNIYGGGGKLLGGTYLILFYVGMLFGKHFTRINLNHISTIITSIILLITTVAWGAFISIDQLQLDSHFSLFFGLGCNPPSISLIVYATLIGCSIYMLDCALRNTNYFSKVYERIAKLGTHTLYIFLYHRLFLDYFWPAAVSRFGLSIFNFWGFKIIYFCCMIVGSLIIEYALETSHTFVLRAYTDLQNHTN